MPLVAIGSKPSVERRRAGRVVGRVVAVDVVALPDDEVDAGGDVGRLRSRCCSSRRARRSRCSGSTVTVFVIVPTVGGATSTNASCRRVGAAGIAARAGDDVGGVDGSRRSPPSVAVAVEDQRPAGSGSRTMTSRRAAMPLLPTTKVYVRPPRQTGGASEAGAGVPLRRRRARRADGRCWFGQSTGHERAQTGSGLSALVIVRSTAGLTVVDLGGGVGDALVLDVARDRRGVEDRRAGRTDDGPRDRDRMRAARVERLDRAAHLRRGDDAAAGRRRACR